LKVKLEDVASKAGVSIATVSRVLNNHPVSEKARISVEEAITLLDYRPNLMARGLKNGQSFRIGVIIPNMENPYFSSIMNSMELRFREEGYLCNFASSAFDDDEQDIVGRFLDSGVDGLINVDVGLKGDNNSLFAKLNQQLPVVLINGNPERTDTNLIIVDQDKGMESVMDHFYKLNHRSIGIVRSSIPSLSFNNKENIYRKKMSEFGIRIQERHIFRIPEADHFETVDITYELFLKDLIKPDRPTAIFCSNELMALGVLKAASELNINVPEDLSIIAQDNTFLSRISIPALTTVDMNASRLGVESAEMMLQLLNSKNPSPRRLIFFPELIIRDSCSEL